MSTYDITHTDYIMAKCFDGKMVETCCPNVT